MHALMHVNICISHARDPKVAKVNKTVNDDILRLLY